MEKEAVNGAAVTLAISICENSCLATASVTSSSVMFYDTLLYVLLNRRKKESRTRAFLR